MLKDFPFDPKKRELLLEFLVMMIFLIVALIFLFSQIFKFDFGSILYGWYASYGIYGLFLGSIIANASLFLPVPIDLVVLVSGDVIHPIVLGLFVGMGAAIGELTAYIIGLGGKKAVNSVIKDSEETLNNIKEKLGNHGMIVIILGAFTPFPFDLIGITAGLIKYDIFKFFIGAYIGKFFRYVLIAYAGLLGLSTVKLFFGLP